MNEKILIENFVLYFGAVVILYIVFFIIGKITNSIRTNNLKKQTDSFLDKISNSKQKKNFLETNKNLLLKYDIKEETTSKKIKEITAKPIDLKSWGVYATYKYKQNQKITYWTTREVTKKIKKGDENVELVFSILDAEIESNKEYQEFIRRL